MIWRRISYKAARRTDTMILENPRASLQTPQPDLQALASKKCDSESRQEGLHSVFHLQGRKPDFLGAIQKCFPCQDNIGRSLPKQANKRLLKNNHCPINDKYSDLEQHGTCPPPESHKDTPSLQQILVKIETILCQVFFSQAAASQA